LSRLLASTPLPVSSYGQPRTLKCNPFQKRGNLQCQYHVPVVRCLLVWMLVLLRTTIQVFYDTRPPDSYVHCLGRQQCVPAPAEMGLAGIAVTAMTHI
jgi:hypothetical protein